MNQSNKRENMGGNAEESSNNQMDSYANQDATEFSETAGTINGAVTGAMIGAQFGLAGAVIGGVSGGAIGNQMGEGVEEENHTASKSRDRSNTSNSETP